ncbi:RNA-processing protein, partial [Candidatus Woesearchaeota archaeon]|nr:RNA-processing protein [Candidatus Woesearchaeota archaeon]
MAEEYSYELKIPRERVAVLIGREGEVKKNIEA